MLKRFLTPLILLLFLIPLARADNLLLTVESDKPVYMIGEKAYFTGRLKNISQTTYIEGSNVEFIFSVSQDGFEIWRWSRLECG